MGKPLLFQSRAIVMTLALVTLLSATAQAQSLYSVEVELDDAASQPRQLAYETALLKVLTRVTGSSLSDDPDLVDELFPDPSAYVVQFSQLDDQQLRVAFDGRAIEATLRNAGQLVWGDDRPLTLIWLAVDWGDGERQLIAADDPDGTPTIDGEVTRQQLLRERLLAAAERRGLPILLPLLDIEDRSRVSFADLWGGFDEAVIEASARYDVSSILIGRLRADGLSVSRWSHYLGEQAVSWGGEPELIVNQVADTLAAEFAIGGDAPLSNVALSVSGITSVDAYAQLQKLLSDVVVIDELSIREVSGDEIRYQVVAHGGAPRLARALRLKGLIEEERIESGFDFVQTDQLSFFFNP
ncbi:MAG: DUF2066 domain-containing protein [Pseudomonadota bacterium]